VVRVGLVGIGFMGWIHYLAYRRSKVAGLVAFASRDAKKRAGDWRGIQGNFGPPGEEIDVSEMDAYGNVEDLLKNPAIDVVDICLPPHLHVPVALAALEAGKHVLCEKPLALTAAEANQLLGAAQRNRKLLMVAQVLPYIGPFQFVLELAQSRKYGQAVGGYFKRVISNPDWIPDFYDPSSVGGPMIDLHVHDTHFIRLLFGMPSAVSAVGRMAAPVGNQAACAKYAHVTYSFADPSLVVASTGGVIDGPGRPFTHGFEVQFEEAFVQFDFAAYQDGCETSPLKIVTKQKPLIRPELPASDDITAFENEIQDMATSVETGAIAPRLNPQFACDALRLAESIQQSVSQRRPIPLAAP
jgi:predicted dehydrogenase